MNPTPATMQLAGDVYEYLTANARKHDQSSYVGLNNHDFEDKVTETNFCNTTLCVAGAAVWLTEGLKGLNVHLALGDFDEIGAELLGLDESEANTLFLDTDNEQALQLLQAVAEGNETWFEAIVDQEVYV